MKINLSGWQVYANVSKVSGVELYDCDSVNCSYITVKFKDGSIYSYTAQNNSVNVIRAMIVFAQQGIGLNRYINLNDPAYQKGELNIIEKTSQDKRLDVTTFIYPLKNSNIVNISYNRDKNWVQVEYKNGDKKTYTSDVCGRNVVLDIIKYGTQGSGLQKYINENEPIALEDLEDYL